MTPTSAQSRLRRRKVPIVSQLTIPGTHGTWPRRVNARWEGWRRWYVVITLRTRQVSIFGSGANDGT
jgi:hypothetical protein